MFAVLRLAVGAVSALGLVGCLAWAFSLVGSPDPLAGPAQVLRETFRGDPASQSALRESATPTALAAFVASTDPEDRAERLTRAARRARDGKPVAELVLLQQAISRPEVDRDQLLIAHGEAASGLAEFPDTQEAYLGDFDRAMADPELRELVADDPLGLAVVKHVPDPELRRFYRDNRDWLEEPLAQLGVGGEKDGLANVLKAARGFYPLTQDAVTRHRLGPLGLALFVGHGELVRRAVDRHKLPLIEVLEAVFANEQELAGVSPDAGADRLETAYSQGQTVWRSVRAAPLSLNLLRDAGEDGAECLRRYGTDDVAGILYLHFPAQVKPAASVVAKFGDRGLFVLREYGGPGAAARERFQKLLAAHGWRVVPVLLQRGMPGLDELEANPRVYDKYFDANGNPKDKEWWARVPIVGAPADLARNLAAGRPVELEEVGWAALDVADAVVIAASLGAATPVIGIKEGAIAGAKQATKEVAAIGAKQVVQVGTKQGAKRAARRELFEAGIGLARRVAAGPLTIALRGGRLMASAASPLRTAAVRVIEVAAKLSPLQRRWLVRGLLGVSVYAAYSRLDAGDLKKLADWLTHHTAELAKGAATALGEQLLKGIEAVLGPLPPGSWRRFVGPATGGVVCLGGFVWGTRPLRRRRGQYVG